MLTRVFRIIFFHEHSFLSFAKQLTNHITVLITCISNQKGEQKLNLFCIRPDNPQKKTKIRSHFDSYFQNILSIFYTWKNENLTIILLKSMVN